MNQQLEELLGAIVFGPNTETLDGIAYTTIKLRSAARLLEYRYADMRREIAEANRAAGGPQLAEEEADTSQPGQQLAPAKRKRAHRKTRGSGNATNGAAHEQQPPLLGDPPTANFDHAMEP